MGSLTFRVSLVVISILLTQYFSEGLQVPQFLKKKYGDQYGEVGQYGHTGHYSDYGGTGHYSQLTKTVGQTKSRTKTKSNTPRRYLNNPSNSGWVTQRSPYASRINAGCRTQPPTPLNSGVRCSMYSGCLADCIPNYQFPNGKRQIRFTCVEGSWKIQGVDWTTTPACEPICLPQCQNNGICVAPNQCNCPENYAGPQCQYENKPCLNYPPMPMNARRVCTTKRCTVTCMQGHEFPDGSEIATMTCKNGLWIPTKENWASLPDCSPTCEPPCQNGGNCLSFNTCQCPQEFRGPQCQYNEDACSAKKLPTNSGYNCSGDSETFSCSIHCPAGIPFEFQPESAYTCYYSTGVFIPNPIPKCVYPDNVDISLEPASSRTYYSENSAHDGMVDLSQNGYSIPPVYEPDYPIQEPLVNETNAHYVPPGYFGKKEGQLVTVEQRLPKPGSCFHWGGTHYKTFDGKVYSFDSKCAHLLVRDSVDNTFSIVAQNHEDCYFNAIHCHKVIRIYLQDKEYFLRRTSEGIPIFGSAKKILPIPGQVPGIRVEMSAHYIVVSMDSVGATIRWDGQQLVQIEAKECLWNRTEGLCGNMDGDIQNDIITKEGLIPKSVVTLATSWKVENLENNCNDLPSDANVCRDDGIPGSIPHKAAEFCQKILSDHKFAACKNLGDSISLFEACRWDYCNCKEEDRTLCACETLNVFVRDCANKGITGLADWRSDDTCPMHCDGGKIYKACGPAKGQPGCGAAIQVDEDKEACVEGCFCPEGTVLHENKCITKNKCPCQLRGKSFPSGSSVPKDCNTCTCNEGQWLCTQIACSARCSAVGDPHYVTFDGKNYDFMGQCSYYLVKGDNFSIEAENTACAGSISQAMNFPSSVSSGLPSCTKTVTIKMNGQIIKLKQNHDVVVNGQDITKVPYSTAGIKLKSVSSIFLFTKLPNGIEIWWDGVTRVYIDLPAKFKERTRGLCGTFNENQKDDFLTPEDDVEQAVIPFANKWKTSEKCNDIPEVISSHPCDKNIQKKSIAEKHCSKIKSDFFKECHWFVDPDQFYQDCLYDMCSCEFQVSRCLCPIISSYATECSRKGIKIDWRTEVRECGVHCPGGQKYQVCGDSCTRTCFDIAVEPDCKPQCAEGCNCAQGQALDDNGECIPIGQCKCQYDGLEFPAGYKEVRPASEGLQLCTCVNALWQCVPATSEETKEFPRAGDLQAKCNISANMEFTTCEPVEPVTCRNMHSPDFFSASVCHSGCQCKEGHVLDTVSNRCVKPTECPCHHGGKSYKENSTVQSDCNTCLCQNGKWKCTDRQCTAECSAWGDSHYKTFDGKHFDYQGQCDYVLAKGILGSDSFDVTIQNVPCGSLGTACSKSVTVRVSSGEESETITLSKDNLKPRYKKYKHAIVREKGLFVIVEATDIGMVLHWDKGTRVYVKLNPRWKDKTKGLCGNYNDNEADDFQTPSGGLAEVSANIFGDSWRLQSYCPEALEVIDTCAERPDRKVWAMKKCGIMKTLLFAPCHSEVPLDYYYEKCVFDSCACDQGGDCECLCTALAAYAQECNNRGVPINWRTQELCPMQCDQRCTKYSPCISSCPEETCDNILINKKISKTCSEDTCIEGCSPKPCPPGYIYSNSSLLDCAPRNVCKPICMEIDGVTYYEGDLLEEDDCHSCYCSMQEKICRGQPCSTTEQYELTTPQMDQAITCKSGWTKWINRDNYGVKKTKSRNKKKEVEPLPTSIILNNLKESNKCTIKKMVDIECRTVKYHIMAKHTGLDVECSLERGLVCKAHNNQTMCPDFEIRVLCQCEEITSTTEYITTEEPCSINAPNTEHPDDCHKFYQCAPGLNGNKLVEKTCGPDMMYNPNTRVCDWPEAVIAIKQSCEAEHVIIEPVLTKCPPGMVEDQCAIKCDSLCLYYSHIVRVKGLCLGETKCEVGCVYANKTSSCSNGMLWADDHTCVSIDSCMCVSDNGEPVKPGKVYEEDICKKCQCIDNTYSCHIDPSCEGEEERGLDIKVKPQFEEKGNVSFVSITRPVTVPPTLPPILVPTSVTPPPLCTEDRYIDLIQGNPPLLDDAFNASSYLNNNYRPSNSRLNSVVTETSGGCWAPKYSNQNQYLQIDLGKQEPVYGVVVRGNPLYEEYVTSYKVLYSPDGHTFYYILNKQNYPVIFRGSADRTTPVKQHFDIPVEAKVIRINPQTWTNAISLRVELIGCAEEESTTPPAPTPYITFAPTPMKPQYCDDQMGVGDGTMSDQQITTSSDLSPEHSKKHLKLNSTSAWQPLTNSPMEWIQFDFLEPRNITGVVTKGGNDGWVKSYMVEYSQNKIDWNPVLGRTQKEKLFLGNYDGNFPQVNNFELPINARYLKIIPYNWHDNIQMRVEIHGCYKPYPPIEAPPPPSECNYCPGVEQTEIELDACRCLANLWWDGENCVNRTQCSCMVGYIPYPVGSTFEKEDCSQCVCKLGGVSYCSPKKCNPCKEGLRSTVTSTCACKCQPCPESSSLCPTSNICINSTLWCNGIQDCPDDELNCPTTTEEITTTTTARPQKETNRKHAKKCPVVTCDPGFKKVLKKPVRYQSYLSPMISGQSKMKNQRKGYPSYRSKTSYKAANRRQNLGRPLPVVSQIEPEQQACKEYKCQLLKPPPKFLHSKDECPPVICQANYIPVYDTEFEKSNVCSSYSCYPPPEPDAVCNVTGRTFSTFDNVEFKYDICNHVLARDLDSDKWDVSLKKNCSTFCSRDLIIRHQDHIFVIHPDLAVEFDGYRYTVAQTKSIGDRHQDFEISQVGSALLFVSHQFGFWIIWNKHGDVKLGVVHKLIEQVDGLCGFFNENPDDDKRTPNGLPARSTVDFGNSWALANDQPIICEAKACPAHIQNKAWEMCNKVKDQSLSPCATVVDIEAFISRCLETTCTCLERAGNNHTAEEECKCQSLQSFVDDCLSANSNLDITDWRMKLDCPITCESPLVYHDCYQRKCEPTCESISDPNICPKVNSVCFPGCYCPPGYVRKDQTCIKPSSCRDCECNVLPHLNYVTYDENNFTVSGNCVYVMSRDIVEGEDTHKFQVLITNHPCRKNNKKMCVGKVTILHEGHKIHILVDEFRNKLKLIVDSERITDFSDISQWTEVKETPTKHLKILLTSVQVEVSVYYPSLGVSVKAPSHKYGGKLEGICGNCNGEPEDDFRTPKGKKPQDENDFALSWLYENLLGGQSREQCGNLIGEVCAPLPPDTDPCNQLLDVNKFGQCLNVLDPSLFIDWCKKDICGGHPELSCNAIEAYARDCANSGFCIVWRNEYCPAKSCPSGQFYDSCGTSSPETCQTIKAKTKSAKKIIPTEGCYCPEGKVFLNDTCVVPKDCEVCDAEGHHPGDKWKQDKCTNCTCEGISLKCDTQQCAGPSTVCERGYDAIKLPTSPEECCDKYACVPEATVGPTCETPQKLVCGKDQVLKLDTKPNGCQVFFCECIPKEECVPIDLTTEIPLEPGYVKEVDNSSCCPVVNLVCKKDICPSPEECPQYHSLKTDIIAGKCCPLYSCEPPKNKCIYETEYSAATKGGERLLGKLEKQKLLKAADETWSDGPCRKCKCVLTNIGNYQPTCSKTDCPSIKTHSDYSDYELSLVPVFEQCCGNVKRTACKYEGKVYQVGEKWAKGNDYCTTMQCVQTPTGLQKETEVKTCEKICELGFAYAEPDPESKECCGTCTQVACVVDGVEHVMGDQWTSDDFCTNYTCLLTNDSVQVQAKVITCPELSEDMKKNFFTITVPVEGQCCDIHVPSACKEGKKLYEIGESWPSPDGDKCKTVKCVEISDGVLEKQVSIETCKKDCKKGWEYRESNITCCGQCVQVGCVIDDKIKKPDDTWTSPDNCTIFTCETLGDQFSVVSRQETCPPLDDCPEEKIYAKGCCKFCNLTSGAQIVEPPCQPKPIELEKTIGILKYPFLLHGQCTNKYPIANFTECVGICHSSTFFNKESGMHESMCSCCQATEYTSIMVELTCVDGEKWKKRVAVPSQCGCAGCSSNKSGNKKSPIRKGGILNLL